MAKIRSLKFRDIPKLKKMISMISDMNVEEIAFDYKSFIPFPLNCINSILPLRFRRLTESFVSIEDKQINGMISLKPQQGNHFAWKICKLFLNKNSYYTGSQLIGYAIARFGALGANTFTVKVDHDMDELLELFSKACGFRVCSSEQLWKMEEISLAKNTINKGFFRPFKNSDSEAAKTIYNDNIFPHFRYSLAKTAKEFENVLFAGLNNFSWFKYVFEDNNSIKGFFSIQTEDNENYILDIDLVQGYDECFPDVINFSIGQIMMRTKKFNLFIINKKFQVSGAKYEEYLKKNGFKCVKNQVVMVKDYYKKIREEQRSQRPAIVFSDISRKPAFKNARQVQKV